MGKSLLAEEKKKVAYLRLIMGILMALAGLAISAAAMISIVLIAGIVLGPLVFLLGIIVAGHSLQLLVRIRREGSVKI